MTRTEAGTDAFAHEPHPDRQTARRLVKSARTIQQTASELGDMPEQLVAELRDRHNRLRQALLQERLERMPLSDLRHYSTKRLPGLAYLDKAGYTNVAEILRAPEEQLLTARGIGAPTLAAISGAAASAFTAADQETVVRLDASRPTPGHTDLLRGLRTLVTTVRIISAVEEARHRIARDLPPTITGAWRACGSFRWLFSGRKAKADAQQALQQLIAIIDGPDTAAVNAALADFDMAIVEARQASDDRVWDDYRQAAAGYQTLLAHIRGSTAEDGAAESGHVPQAVVRQARQVSLDTTWLTVRLRAYQAFGARYVLSRSGAILGDEMGLGKTIEAIAVMAHLARKGPFTCLVVVPPSVVINWIEEIAAHSRLSVLKIHGPDRADPLRRWKRDGGIAVTTYRLLDGLALPAGMRMSLLIVDEAHMIKNPQAARSRYVATLADRADRILLLTGTPMENRVTEFRNLVQYLDPHLASTLLPSDAAVAEPVRFRQRVAAVYLRRNQEDVLRELPELVEVDDWVELDTAEQRAYTDAVSRRHFPDMRQAAYDGSPRQQTAKIARLREIVAECADNGWKILIVSQFRRVISAIEAALAASPRMVLTGATPAAVRHQEIARFTAYDGHIVLIGQIEAVGQGVNLQAASVVIIAEPQVKPSTEEQAIRRAYRMGQSRAVRVHRLLAKDTVDDHLEDILRDKRKLFRTYAHESDAKRAHASATDPAVLDREIDDMDQQRIIDAELDRIRKQQR